MGGYVVNRILQVIPLLIAVSIISFIIIDLPPGDFLSTYIEQLNQQGTAVTEQEVLRLRLQYGLDQPVLVRYWSWITNIVLRGDFGYSFQYNRPVAGLIGERIGVSLSLAALTILVTYAIAIPAGIYSAVYHRTALDYVVTFIGFIGLALPNFLLALVLVWISFAYFDFPVTGLFSAAYADAPWSFAKFLDLLAHLWLPVIIIATSGTAAIIRVMRGGMLDELNQQYVVTARAKGVPETRIIFKYPARVAINPIVSTIGWLLPATISQESVVSIILNIPSAGPLLLNALLAQDMYLAGSFILILSVLTVLGTLVSDLLLASLDPRVRFGGGSR